ncbi:MAG: PEP-CTERM sorting domain-containing protein [Verrucomicrobiales bacterium]|jgi:hypothetical protein|nr:PEP-CTERM sorting domain-containing protein [Verrucomicrobiales bacterium]
MSHLGANTGLVTIQDNLGDPYATHNYSLVMDTTGATWTVQYFLDGTAISDLLNMNTTPSLNQIAIGVSSGNYYVTGLSLYDLATIPEPSVWLLLAGGFGLLACLRRRRA